MNKKITVLYICHEWNAMGGATFSLIDLINAVQERTRPIVLLPHDGPIREIFDTMGVETLAHPFFYLWEQSKRIKTIIHHPSKSTLYHYLTDNKRCAKYIKEQLNGRQIDIVHSNSSITTVGHEIAQLLQVKHIWHIREYLDLDFGITPYMGFRGLRKKINAADARICISKAVAQHWRLKKENTFVAWDAVECGNAAERNTKPYLLFCAAHLSNKKGADCAIKAFRDSGVADEGYILRLVGQYTNEYKEYLDSLAGDYKTSISYEGYQPDVSKYFAEATAFLMCSRFEGLGRVTIEAMYHGCPVIARNSGGTTDYITDKENGFLFNTDEECAKLIKSVTESPNINIVSNKAQEFANQNFSKQVYQKKILKIYDTVCKSEE